MVAKLPRHLRGASPSARTHNVASAELDALSRGVTVRRIHASREIEGLCPPNFDLIIPWEVVSSGVNRGNWNFNECNQVKITESGTYLMLLQIRWNVRYDEPQSLSGYQVLGRRWARIMLNGTSPVSDTIGQCVRPGTLRVGGLTTQAFSCRNLQAGDVLYTGFRSSHLGPPAQAGAGVSTWDTDWGGTYFTIARIGPGAGTLVPDTGGGGGAARFESRSLPPAETFNIFAQAIDNLGVCAKPRRTSGFTLPANVATALTWQTDGLDTRGDMWDPAEPSKLVVRISGTYLLELQVRFPVAGGSATGERWCALYRNTTTEPDVIARDDGPGGATFEGATRVVRAIIRLAAGDILYGVAGTNVAVQAGTPDAGGSYLFAARIGRSGEGGSILEGFGFDVDPVVEPDAIHDVIAAIAG